MELKKVKLDKEDLNKLKMLKSVVNQGKYEMKGDAINMVASLINWIDVLEIKIEEALKKPAKAPKVEKIK